MPNANERCQETSRPHSAFRIDRQPSCSLAASFLGAVKQ
jgi:hypothetical protein